MYGELREPQFFIFFLGEGDPLKLLGGQRGVEGYILFKDG